MVMKYRQNVVRTFGSIQSVQGIALPLWLSSGLASFVWIPISPEAARNHLLTPGVPSTVCAF